MDPLWDIIALWATSEERRLAFAHIQSPPDPVKEIELPLYILESPRIRHDVHTLLVQVLPDFKKDEVVKLHSKTEHPLVFPPVQPQPPQKLVIATCIKVIEYLKSRYQGKQSGFYFYPFGAYTRIIFIIDADPDYSAEFALALATITTFAASVTTAERDLYIKVATMSSECIHQVTKELFESHSDNFRDFRPSQHDRGPKENRASEHRMKVRKEHAAGFMAALGEFDQWPPGIVTLFNIVQQKDMSHVFEDARTLLVSHGLMNKDKKTPVIRLPPRNFYSAVSYALLPVVEYDWRIAYFLSIPSSPLVTLIKAHLASTLTALSEMFHVITSDLERIQSFLTELRLKGGTYAWSSRSTLWAGLGLSRMVHGRTSSEATIPVAEGGIRVLPEFYTFHLHRVKSIRKTLVRKNVEVAKEDSVNEDVDEEHYSEISRDLLRAYVHQVAFAFTGDFQQGGLPTLYDFYTEESFETNLNLAMVN
ncbi:hypothetical protein IL306_014432 [Fusarium sp. DS 682]|nr:hypothetical protein IL306_014432 [Fusarium sp. DS 682]